MLLGDRASITTALPGMLEVLRTATLHCHALA